MPTRLQRSSACSVGRWLSSRPTYGLPVLRHPPEAEIPQRVAVIELKSGHVAFLDAQRRYRFKSNRFDTKRRGTRKYVLPKRQQRNRPVHRFRTPVHPRS